MITSVPSDTLPENDADARRWKSSTGADLDTLFKVLSDRLRRETLMALQAADEPVALPELVSDVGDDADDQIRTSLVHVHLPMLEATGLVTWDRPQESVELNTVPDRYHRFFSTFDGLA